MVGTGYGVAIAFRSCSFYFLSFGPIHNFLLVFLGWSLISGLGVVLFTNPIYFAFSLGLVLVCISLFYILSNSDFVAAAQLLIYVGAVNVLVMFAVMFMNGSDYSKDFQLLLEAANFIFYHLN